MFSMQAEEVNIKGRVYHKKCLSCKHCKRPIDISILAVGPDDEIYCQICCNKISWPGSYVGSSDTTLIQGDEEGPNNCPRCGGKVSMMNISVHTIVEFYGGAGEIQ